MTQSQAKSYYLPSPSTWPITGSIMMGLLGFGAAFSVNGYTLGFILLACGFGVMIYLLYGWFSTVARESEAGKYNKQVDTSFRWGMSWFIFSEVMFFAVFFGTLFYMRVLSVPWLAEFDQKLLWPDFSATWPVAGPGIKEAFTPMGAWGIPAINTMLLLSSGVTVTLAHWALIRNDRMKLIGWLFATIALGLTFLGFQFYEYGHAYSELNLKLTTGAYGATFFMLTGFHGFHVTVGCIMLISILFRCVAGHFSPDHHFGFEGVAWYWHFVDVVWLLLFILVYWL
ncbi:MAG: cytochrome c oxidase subunit 3 [Betaproteobacteria bacterium]|jgi:cytochrome c oxidase subunit 3|nr:MAG: MFS transporter [Betaproteobacteria bacterium SG8_41]UCF75286.1 MAG: cytochrome c oxidase subunit 3 [Betaproteobacteria bacterium]